MNAAIFYSGQYGSTEQYARWIGEATGLPVFDVNDRNADPKKYDLLILGSSVIVYKLTIRNWVKRNWASIKNSRVILFTVSGIAAGPKLDRWIAESLPKELIGKWEHVALRGRMDPKRVSWWDRMMLRVGAWNNTDPEGKKQELEGFDFVDKSSIESVLERIQRHRSAEDAAS